MVMFDDYVEIIGGPLNGLRGKVVEAIDEDNYCVRLDNGLVEYFDDYELEVL